LGDESPISLNSRGFAVDIIGLVQGRSPEGVINGVVAHPLLLGWDGMMWEPRRAMNNGPMSAQEARISLLKQGSVKG